MIQKRILMAVAVPVVAAVARAVASKLRRGGKTTAAARIDQLVDMVSPQKKQKQKKGGFSRR